LTYRQFNAGQKLSELVTGLFCGTAARFAASYREKRTKGLYQWLSRRASSFRSDKPGDNTNCTVRTEVTVEQQGTILLVGGGTAVGFDTCPLCGTKLAPEQAEQARLRLPKGPVSA
jgi:hypothetical protein